MINHTAGKFEIHLFALSGSSPQTCVQKAVTLLKHYFLQLFECLITGISSAGLVLIVSCWPILISALSYTECISMHGPRRCQRLLGSKLMNLSVFGIACPMIMRTHHIAFLLLLFQCTNSGFFVVLWSMA